MVRVAELLHRPAAEVIARIEPDDPRLAGLLYEEAPSDARLISGGSLCSQAATPFVLDGVTYPSIRRFYDTLKIPPELRARFVAGATRQELGVPRGRAGSRFSYGDAVVEVGSTTHLQLIARAVSAKVAAHEWVRRELRATGRVRLVMGTREALGRAMPFALMVERLHLGPRDA